MANFNPIDSPSPRVSFIIPALNEEAIIETCLDHIARQRYPKDNLEVFVIDAHSTDQTVSKTKTWADDHDFPVTVLNNPRKIAEFGKAVAIRESSGDYIVLLDADNTILSPDWLEKAVTALESNPDTCGFESVYISRESDSLLNRYLTSGLHISDSLAEAIAPRPECLKEEETEYGQVQIFQMKPGYPFGANGFIYRRTAIEWALDSDTFEEGEISLRLEKEGRARVIRMPGVGVHHDYAQTLKPYLRKRKKIALKHMTRRTEKKTWVQHNQARLVWAVFCHLTLIIPFAVSLYRWQKSKEIAWLLHAPVSFLTTGAYLVYALQNKLSGKKAW